MDLKLESRQSEVIRQPIALGPATLKNRVFVAPHTTNFGEAGVNLITPRHLAYHQARARGGAGLIITEGIRVHPTSLRRLGIQAYSDESLPGLRALADTVHAEGAALFAQLLHTGRHSGDEHAGSWGAGATPWTTAANVPHVMNEFDFDTLLAGYVGAAERLISSGFDGMELHLGHGHLLQQFLSPVTNDRTDRYGGSFEGRIRLASEVLRAVSETVAGRGALGLRISADEFLAGGLHADEMVEIVARLAADTRIDFLHVSHSAYIGTASLATQMADMTYPRTPFRHLPARFKREFPDIPVLAICRIDTVQAGAEMIAEGDADLVGFARGHITEPNLTVNSLDPAAPQPRTCIACNQGCNANLEAIIPITCTVNPAVGKEREWAAVESAPAIRNRVVVVGAGPGGLEAAIAASRRGHDVELFDARPEPGGQLLDVVRLDGRSGFRILHDELLAAFTALPVRSHFGVRVTADDLLRTDPAVIVLATGAAHRRSRLATPGGIPVLDPEQVLEDPARAGARVLVVDDLGAWEAYGIAMHLARRGARVEVVTPVAGYATRVTVYSRLGLADQLRDAGVTVRDMTSVEMTGAGVALTSGIGFPAETRPDLTSIVHVRPRAAQDALVEELRSTGWQGELHLVGDAFAPRTSQEAIAEGRGVGLLIGTSDRSLASGIGARPPYRYPHSASVHRRAS